MSWSWTLNHKSVFLMSDEVTNPHSPLRDVTMLSIVIENVVLVVPREKLQTFPSVCFDPKARKRVFEFLSFFHCLFLHKYKPLISISVFSTLIF